MLSRVHRLRGSQLSRLARLAPHDLNILILTSFIGAAMASPNSLAMNLLTLILIHQFHLDEAHCWAIHLNSFFLQYPVTTASQRLLCYQQLSHYPTVPSYKTGLQCCITKWHPVINRRCIIQWYHMTKWYWVLHIAMLLKQHCTIQQYRMTKEYCIVQLSCITIELWCHSARTDMNYARWTIQCYISIMYKMQFNLEIWVISILQWGKSILIFSDEL